MRGEKKLNYYNETVSELYKRLESSERGLTEEEAKKRLEKYGENKLTEQKKKSNIALFFGQFKDFMVILLIFASIFSAVISYIQHESYVDSIIIIIIVIINAINVIPLFLFCIFLFSSFLSFLFFSYCYFALFPCKLFCFLFAHWNNSFLQRDFAFFTFLFTFQHALIFLE